MMTRSSGLWAALMVVSFSSAACGARDSGIPTTKTKRDRGSPADAKRLPERPGGAEDERCRIPFADTCVGDQLAKKIANAERTFPLDWMPCKSEEGTILQGCVIVFMGGNRSLTVKDEACEVRSYTDDPALTTCIPVADYSAVERSDHNIAFYADDDESMFQHVQKIYVPHGRKWKHVYGMTLSNWRVRHEEARSAGAEKGTRCSLDDTDGKPLVAWEDIGDYRPSSTTVDRTVSVETLCANLAQANTLRHESVNEIAQAMLEFIGVGGSTTTTVGTPEKARAALSLSRESNPFQRLFAGVTKLQAAASKSLENECLLHPEKFFPELAPEPVIEEPPVNAMASMVGPVSGRQRSECDEYQRTIEKKECQGGELCEVEQIMTCDSTCDCKVLPGDTTAVCIESDEC